MALHFKSLQVSYLETVWSKAQSCVCSTKVNKWVLPVLMPSRVGLEIVSWWRGVSPWQKQVLGKSLGKFLRTAKVESACSAFYDCWIYSRTGWSIKQKKRTAPALLLLPFPVSLGKRMDELFCWLDAKQSIALSVWTAYTTAGEYLLDPCGS